MAPSIRPPAPSPSPPASRPPASTHSPTPPQHPKPFIQVIRGTQVPADGVVVSGQGFVDEALVTGESLPVTKRAGDRVVGGSVSTEGLFTMRVTGIGEDSTLRQIVRLMEEAQMAKAPIQALADRLAGSFALWVLAASLLTFFGWALALSLPGVVPPAWIPADHRGSPPLVLALTLGVSTLVVACPCAMGLATPTAIMVGTGVGARHGVLIKGGEALETAYRLSAVVFDKTGTLTRGEPAVEAFVVLEEEEGEGAEERVVAGGTPTWARVLWLVASAERGSEHPLAKCLVRYAHAVFGPASSSTATTNNNTTTTPAPSPRTVAAAAVAAAGAGGAVLAEPEGFRAVSGKGLVCAVDGEPVAVGTLAWLAEVGCRGPSPAATVAATAAEAQGKIVVWAAVGGVARARVEILDSPRPEAAAVLRALTRRLGLEVYMVTGDNARTAATVARAVGVPPGHVMAETLPSNKVAKIKALQVGDGWVDGVLCVDVSCLVRGPEVQSKSYITNIIHTTATSN